MNSNLLIPLVCSGERHECEPDGYSDQDLPLSIGGDLWPRRRYFAKSESAMAVAYNKHPRPGY